ncbi:hypothetical protein [Paenibacillus wenxiniae]|uniref:Uncharacterized protein n=1 Tax=Paenibacillus wenxiniae TaxID=1636843 RepID=A0ABW4RGY6_9BACL
MIISGLKVERLIDFIESNRMTVSACEYALPQLEALWIELKHALDSNDSDPDDMIHNYQQQLHMKVSEQLSNQIRELIRRITMLSAAIEEASIQQLQQQLYENTKQLRQLMERHNADTVEQLEQWRMEAGIEDFYVLRQTEQGRLVIAGSRDYSYYHNVELIFHEVQFMMLPAQIFTAERLRLATTEEVADLNEMMYGHQQMGRVFCLESLFEGTRYYVVARQLEYNTDTVYYYKREPLGPGERIAEYLSLHKE